MCNKNFRVLQLGKFYPIRGGVEKVAYDLAVGLSEHGIDCDMMCAAMHGGSRILPLGYKGKMICTHTWTKMASTMISPTMVSALRKRCCQYDIIHVHHPDPMACLALLLSGYKGKVVLHWHSDIQKQKWMLRLYQPLQQWLLRRADLIVGTSPAYLEQSPCLQEVQGKTVCLPIGIAPICPRQEDVEKIQRRYHGKKIVFTLGRLVAYKGYQYLIEAAYHLSDDYIVLIGGDGDLKWDLDATIRTWGVEDKVKLLGRIPDEDLPGYYGACKVFCLSSVQKTEAFGIVQIEAMSCGKPVVATNIPQSGVPWVNAHGISGLNVSPRNAQELAKAIMAIAEDETAYKGYAQRAEKRYREMFTKEEMIGKLLNIYNNLWKEQKQ